ncbi:serpin B5-like [Venturia canescens]|uniref:serpin B5-like n=1 Tax=Venturia canescens TaxID=32260 RepID=UPI001C9CAC3D|nr:serpin B5-like [Venturia canescens]
MNLLFIASILTLHPSQTKIARHGTLSIANLTACEKDNAIKKIADGINKFTDLIAQEIVRTEKSNFVFCPLSAALTLHLASFGTTGTSRKIMQSLLPPTVFHSTDPEPACVHQVGVKRLIEKMSKYADSGLKTVNEIYVTESSTLAKIYKDVIDYLGVKTTLVNDDPAATGNALDDNCRGNMENAINDVSSSLDISDETKIIITCAVLFKGMWLKKFNLEKSQKDFYVKGIHSEKRTFISITGKFNNGEESGYTWVEIPYASKPGFELSMMIILPKNTPDSARIVSKDYVNNLFIEDLLAKGRSSGIHIELPKFEIKSANFDMYKILNKMSYSKELFHKKYTKMPMLEKTGLRFHKFVLSTVITVDENGKEDIGEPPIAEYEFIANRPFLAIIFTRDEYKIKTFVARYSG